MHDGAADDPIVAVVATFQVVMKRLQSSAVGFRFAPTAIKAGVRPVASYAPVVRGMKMVVGGCCMGLGWV